MRKVGKLIEKNLTQISKNIEAHLPKAEDPKAITLVAVTKKQSLKKIEECLANQLFDLGENYLQEALLKRERFPQQDIRWHFIGSVQSKKVKTMLGKFYLWHGVDRLSVLEEIDKRNFGSPERILIQVNVAEETSKSGVLAKDLPAFLEKAQQFKGFQVFGLMTMPPLFSSEMHSRSHFVQMRKLLDANKKNVDIHKHPMNQLSMGTSQDYIWAIQEGATIIRLGEILLGPRES